MMADEADSALSRREFEELYTKFGPRLVAYIRGQVGDAATASDLLQDIFVRLLRSPVRRASEGEMKAYLYRVASSVVVDHFRREQRAQRWSLRARSQPPAGPATSGVGVAFRRLKPKDRTLLWLAYVEGMNHREIAGAAGVRESSVKVLLFRARKRLAGSLKEAGVNPENTL